MLKILNLIILHVWVQVQFIPQILARVNKRVASHVPVDVHIQKPNFFNDSVMNKIILEIKEDLMTNFLTFQTPYIYSNFERLQMRKYLLNGR